MKKYLLIILMLYSIQNFAQEVTEQAPQQEGINREKLAQTIDALKVAYITKQLDLTPEEAQKFWPVYNVFAIELKKAKIEFKQDDLAFEEKKVGIMKKYKEDFKKLLNIDSRVNKCFRAEPEFHKLLRAEWVRRQGIRQQNHQPGMGGSGMKPQQPKAQQPPAMHPHRPFSSNNRGGLGKHKG
jgi:hypothetical protein